MDFHGLGSVVVLRVEPTEPDGTTISTDTLSPATAYSNIPHLVELRQMATRMTQHSLQSIPMSWNNWMLLQLIAFYSILLLQ